jgi:hypothetical protein
MSAGDLSAMVNAAWRRGRRTGHLEGFLVGVTIGAVTVLLFGH